MGPTRKFEYVICRIVGGELPPRDLVGSRIKIFKYIFENEFVGQDATRLWVLNKIPDSDYSEQVKKSIIEADESYVDLEIDWRQYISAGSRSERLNSLIGINQARNEAFKKARQMGNFAVILDGDCFFNEDAWNITVEQVSADQKRHPERRYYAVPSVRISLDEFTSAGLGKNAVEVEEPMLVMRHDATELFNESVPFGQADKVEFLERLGLAPEMHKFYVLNSEGPCHVAGMVIHLSVGGEDIEKDSRLRYVRREDSLDYLIRKADIIAVDTALHEGLLKYFIFRTQVLYRRLFELPNRYFRQCWFIFRKFIRRLVTAGHKAQKYENKRCEIS